VLLNTSSQQDTERYPADLPDPEQAQRVTIGRPEAEELLVDTPYILEDTEDQEVGEVQEKPTGEDLCSDPGRSEPAPLPSATVLCHSREHDVFSRYEIRI
jgi:hypothetical protein